MHILSTNPPLTRLNRTIKNLKDGGKETSSTSGIVNEIVEKYYEVLEQLEISDLTKVVEIIETLRAANESHK